jgi:hypothetical protein
MFSLALKLPLSGFTRLDAADDHKWHRLVLDRVIEIVDESDHPVPTG